MRLLTAISFQVLLLFNLCGYRLVLSCLQAGTQTALERRLDKKDYRDEELISIKTRLDLPYYTNTAGYERAYGSVSLNGQDYEYVKRRVYNDTLELLCLPNPASTQLKKMGNDCARASADGHSGLPVKKGGTVIKVSLPDFVSLLPAAAVMQAAGDRHVYFLYNINPSGIVCPLPQDRPPRIHPFLS